ncbi:MAG TPA: glycosyltransferase [Patescibacteria group bacterium]
MAKILLSVGICLYNEEKNISRLLSCVLTQRTSSVQIDEIILVISGSTDKTLEIAKQFAQKNKKIKIIHQKKRQGKALAVNEFISTAKNEILILLGGDVYLEETIIEKLGKKFINKTVGMTGAHPIPINKITDGFLGFAGNLLWDLHHRLSLKHPKMGEVIAFRKIFRQIPVSSSVDEANIEPLIKGQGYTILYVPTAKIYNKTPTTIKDFIEQRRRIFSGHLAVKNEQGYQVATLKLSFIIKALYSFLEENPKPIYILYTFFVILLEGYSRFLGFLDYKVYKKDHRVWTQITSTKQLFED